MKKLMMLILALALCLPAMAETPSVVLPVKILEHEEAAIPLADALTTAKKAIDKVPEQSMIRAELVEMTDGSKAWIVNIFDYANFLDAWCITVDAVSGKTIAVEYGECGYFEKTMEQWTLVKGNYGLWSLEDKLLYDLLYFLTPDCGLPMEGDMSAEQALNKALFLLGLTSADGYDVGYGFLKGGEGYNGIWEIYLVQNGQVVYRVNLDAKTGELYYMEPDEAGNG